MPPIVENQLEDLSFLENWIKQNKKVDLLTAKLNDESNLAAFTWTGLESQKEVVKKQLKAYQRIMNILPKKNHALAMSLLRENIHSAIQIASVPKQTWLDKYAKLFNRKSVSAEAFYDAAVTIKSRLLLKHLQRIS